MAAAFAVGDVHGCRDALVGLLRDAGLIDSSERWAGAGARLWLLGDLADRGPDGIGTIELVMRLERESVGSVRCLLGNHDALLLATARHGDEVAWDDGETFRENWLLNGGRESDLRRVDPSHLAWIETLPPVAREGDWLLVHADTDLYLGYGSSPEGISASVAAVLRGGEAGELGTLVGVLSDRFAFVDPARLGRLLAVLGGARVVHGHTPIPFATGRDPASVTEPLVYADGLAVNADHCLFAGGPGFVVRLS